ncbi:hypothetical protein SAMN00017477_1338 [Peptoniphilus asaccharolyticus DSM 20463]|uniref:Uncharacterized protein n=1 Tax=Peptoniphilus asaccharolyticus DSM 20463 TaxID=573058 RepID=A0A1W1V459_PEPAS|nr:hypothetical protein [Peptoniphilus asaccharolyticus]MBL7576284.1 hypothetical protein [Peptoniphilus asaccharolyticus]SMB88095.1 hypothetical protein SAMN00017477_1338 [Peptoniphilus asaccharolyticus DSM 20463]
MSRRNKKNSNKKVSQMLIVAFFLGLLLISYNVLAERNKVIHIELGKTSYIELLKYEDSSMKTINDRIILRDILLRINDLGAKEIDMTTSPVSEKFINVYDKNYKKTMLIKSGKYMKVENKWYLLDERSANSFDKIFDKYN